MFGEGQMTKDSRDQIVGSQDRNQGEGETKGSATTVTKRVISRDSVTS